LGTPSLVPSHTHLPCGGFSTFCGVSVVVDVLAAFMRKNGVVSDMFYRIAESREVNTWRRNGFERILQVPFPPSGLGGTYPHLSGWREDAVTRGEKEGGVVVEGGPTLSVHFSLPSPAHPGDNQSLEITVFHLQQPLTLGSLLRRGAWAQVETYNEPFHNVPFR